MINRDPVSMIERGRGGDGAKEGPSSRLSVVEPEEDEKKDSVLSKKDSLSVDADAVTVVVTDLEEFKADNVPGRHRRV